MWDLDTLRAMNARACLGARAQTKEVPEPVLPLQDLADRLTVGPPSLHALVDLFEQSESLGDFLNLVREYLPNREREIMAGSIDDRLERFCRLFEQRYFPLSDQARDELDLASFCAYIPIDLMGISYDDYHDFEGFRQGLLMMISLIVYPYIDAEPEPCSRGMFTGHVGGRVPIIEEVAKLVGKQLASEIPEKGWEPEDLHRMTDGTKYDGLAACADWIYHSTDCMVLDASYEEYSGEAWSRDVVNDLAAQWPKVKEVQGKINALAEWLEGDPRANFQELLSFLLDRKLDIIPKEQLPLPLDNNGQVDPKRLIEIFGNERGISESEIVQAATF